MHGLLPLMLVTALSSAPQFDFQLLDGSRVSGGVAGWDAAKVLIEGPGGRSSLDIARLASITPQKPPAGPARKPAVWVDLVDGSQLAAAEFTAQQGRAKIVFSDTETLQVPTAEVDAVRLQPTSDATAVEWSRIRGKNIRGDVLVTGNANAIDYHQGAIDDVSDARVRFVLDTQTLGVKRGKIFGLIYFHATTASAPDSPYTIVDAAGSRWAASGLKLNGDMLEFTTSGGRTIRRGLSEIAKIDLSCGKIVYLSDLKPDSESFTPYPFTLTQKELASRLAFSRVRRDQNLESKSLRTYGHVYNKGLAVRSRSELAWSLPGKFSRLEAIAGIDDDVRPLGNVRLQILGDGRPLLDSAISGNDKAATPISLDVSGVRRLVLIVETRGNFATADYLDLGNMRLIK